MCGRYVTVTKIKEVEKRFNVVAENPEQYRKNTNISHGQLAPIITNSSPDKLQFFQFGFTPFWAKKNMYVINARSEGDFNKEDDPRYTGSMGIFQKPMFRTSIRKKRCLVVADAFIEGPKKEKLSKPYCVYLRNKQRPFALAGIWDEWVNKDSGEIIHSFAIITTTANELMDEIGHHRSPVILHREMERAWLDESISPEEISEMLHPYPADQMNAYPIAPEIKDPRNNGLDLLKPLDQPIFEEKEFKIYEDLKLFGMGESRARSRKSGK